MRYRTSMGVFTLLTLFPIRKYFGVLAVALLGWCQAGAALAQSVEGAAIASAHPLATQAGLDILRRGGNAFDAAVAVSAALAVVEPYSSGFGGGAYFLLHRAADGYQTMVDARETAPSGAHADMYLDAGGKAIAGASLTGAKAAAIPGMPAGLVHLSERYGRLPLAASLAPAIQLAREGFRADERYSRLAQLRERVLVKSPEATQIFLVDGKAPAAGQLLRNTGLAATMQALAERGRRGFYSGPVARALVESVRAQGGIWQPVDLWSYSVVERAPVTFTYRGARITTAAPSSGGGVTLAQALNILEQLPLADAHAPSGAHLVVEALRRAFQDRNRYLGDPAYVPVPLAQLTGKPYAHQRALSIDPLQATRSDSLSEDAQLAQAAEFAQGTDTTHFSVIDAQGNRVAATLSINYVFGAGVVAGGTGVLLNDEMDDFTVRRDTPNAYRLKSGAANAIAPSKRPLSSMTPTFVEDGRGVLVLGSPGGSRIISQVLLAVLDYLQQPQVDLQRTLKLPRFHHQFWPDELEIEPSGFGAEWVRDMEARGHKLRKGGRLWGNMQAVFKDAGSGAAQAANDPRGSGEAWY